MGIFDSPSRVVDREHGDLYRKKANRLAEEGRHLFSLRKFDEAEERVRQLIDLQGNVVGERHAEYATGLTLLAEVLLARDELNDAEILLQRALEIRKKTLGDQHPDFASSLDLLARVFLRWEDDLGAEPLLRQARDVRLKALGGDHPEAVASLSALAQVVGRSDQSGDAEALLREAIDANRRVHGEDSRDAASCEAHLAELLQRRGDLDEAEPLLRRAIEIFRRTAGETDPDYARCLSGLAALLLNRGDHAAAEPLWWLLLDMRRQASGAKHPECAAIQTQLALILQRRGDHLGSQNLLRQAAEVRRHALGERHPEYAASLTHLASVLQRQGNLEAAEPLLRQALAIRKDVLGVRHPEYATSLINLAQLVQKRGDVAWAKLLLKEAVELRQSLLGESHPDYAQSLVALAEAFAAMGEAVRAEPLLRKAMEIRGNALGESHPIYAATLTSLAGVLRVQGAFEEAEERLVRALEIRHETIGELHPDYVTTLNNLAWLLQRRGERAGAESLLTRALELRRHTVGADHPEFRQVEARLKRLRGDNADVPASEPAAGPPPAPEPAEAHDHPEPAVPSVGVAYELESVAVADPESAAVGPDGLDPDASLVLPDSPPFADEGLENAEQAGEDWCQEGWTPVSGRDDGHPDLAFGTFAEGPDDLAVFPGEITPSFEPESWPASEAASFAVDPVASSDQPVLELQEPEAFDSAEPEVSHGATAPGDEPQADPPAPPLSRGDPSPAENVHLPVTLVPDLPESGGGFDPRASRHRSLSMSQSSSDLSQALSELADRFSELGERMLAAARQLHSPGSPPSPELIDEITACRGDFVEFRDRALTVAGQVGVSHGDPDSLQSLEHLSDLLDQVAEVELRQSKSEEAHKRALSVLDRVLMIRHSGSPDFAPLAECHDQARALRSAVESEAWDSLSPETEQLAEGEHRFAHLLSLVEDHDELGDDLWASHHESVGTAFGKALAAAAARSKLVMERHPSGMTLVGSEGHG